MLGKLDSRISPVKLALLLAACGPSPRPAPLAPLSAPDESFRDSLQVVWDVNAGSGARAPLLYTDSAVVLGTTNRQLLAFSTNTGRKLWDQRFEGEIPDRVTRNGRTLFFVTSEFNGRLYARDLERGRKVWRVNFGPARFSPLLDGGIVYAGNDHGVLAAFRSEDGSEIWRTRVNGSVNQNLLNYGDVVLAISGTDSIYAFAKRDGALLRRAKVMTGISAPAALRADTVVLVSHAGDVAGIDAQTFHTLWKVPTGAPILASPVVTRDGIIHVMNRNTDIWRIAGGRGERVASLNGAASKSFTATRDRYLVGDVNGSLYVTDREGRLLFQHHFNESIHAPAVIGGGAVYVTLGRGRIVKLR